MSSPTDCSGRVGFDSPAATAELALLLEVAGTPKPGNVDRQRDLPDLRFEHFLAGAVGARDGLELAATGASVGVAFERAVNGMAKQRGGNTQFGCLLLLVPLVAAAASDDSRPVSQPLVESVVESTTVADAAAFYRAFDHVDVFVGAPPADLEALDVRRGSAAVDALEDRGLTLLELLAASAPGDDVAREWTTGFERSFEAAERVATLDASRPATDRIAELFLSLLADRSDTLVATKHGEEVAAAVTERARMLLEEGAFSTPAGRQRVDAFADDLVADGINPGTTADLTAAGLFIALEHGTLEI